MFQFLLFSVLEPGSQNAASYSYDCPVHGVRAFCGGVQQAHYFHADYLGSVRLVTDITGAGVWLERYKPFGSEAEQSGSIQNDYRFTGKAWDAEAGLYYFKVNHGVVNHGVRAF